MGAVYDSGWELWNSVRISVLSISMYRIDLLTDGITYRFWASFYPALFFSFPRGLSFSFHHKTASVSGVKVSSGVPGVFFFLSIWGIKSYGCRIYIPYLVPYLGFGRVKEACIVYFKRALNRQFQRIRLTRPPMQPYGMINLPIRMIWSLAMIPEWIWIWYNVMYYTIYPRCWGPKYGCMSMYSC